jgi:TPR repeat protein
MQKSIELTTNLITLLRSLPTLTRLSFFVCIGLMSFSLNANADFKAGVVAYKSANYAAALTEFTAAAEAGNAQAQYLVGSMYDNGQGTTANDTEAIKWYARAAHQGFVTAQYNLGMMLVNGEGIEKPDYMQAYAWFSIAAAKADKESVNMRDLLAGRMNEPTLKAAKTQAEKLSNEIKPQ